MSLRQDELRIAKRIADRNARFLKATPAMQRVMVAQDVIEAINAGEFVPASGTYLGQGMPRYSAETHSVEIEPRCVGCALGATFVAFFGLLGRKMPLKRNNSGDIHFLDATTMRDTLQELFGLEQLLAMECAFEGWNRDASAHGTDETFAFNRGEDLCRLDDDAECLRRVMRNVIRNRGTFVPGDREPL